MRSRLGERCSIMLLIIVLSVAAMAGAATSPPPSFLADLAREPDLSALLASLPKPQAVGEVVNTMPQTLDLNVDWTATSKDDNVNGDANSALDSMILPDFKPTKTPFENAYVTSETNNFTSKDNFNIDYFVKYNSSEMMNAQSCGESGLDLANGGVIAFCLLGTDTATDFASQLMDPCKVAGLGCISKSTTLVKADTPGICHIFEKTATQETNAFPVMSNWGKECSYIVYHPDCVKISGVPRKWEYADKMTFSKDSVVVREFKCKKDYTKSNNEVLKATCDRHGKTKFSEDLCKVDFGILPQIDNFVIGGIGSNTNFVEPTVQITDGSTDQVTDGSTDQGTDVSTDQGTDVSTDQVTDGSTDQVTDGSTDQVTDGSTDQVTDGSTDQVTDGSTDQVTDGSTDQVTDGSTDQITDGSTDQITDGSTDQVPDVSTDQVTDGSTDQVTDGSTDQVTDGSTDQGTDGSISLGTDESTDQGTDGSISLGTDESTDQGTDGSISLGTDESTDQGTDVSTDQVTDVSTDQVPDVSTDQVTDGSTDQVTDGSTDQGTDGSTDQETGGTVGGTSSIEKLSGGELGFNFNQFQTRVVTTTQFPYYKCPPNTINLDTKKTTSKTFFWTNNYCHFFSDNVSGYAKPGIKCTGSNYNSYDENGVIEDYKSEVFERDLTEEELQVKKCGLQCVMIGVEFARKLNIFVDFDEDEMADLSCYYYDNLATTLIYYNVDYFKWVTTLLGAQTTP